MSELGAGDNPVLRMTIKKEDGTLLDLTNCVIIWTLSKNKYSITPFVQKTKALGGIVVVGLGICDVLLTSEDTMLSGKWYHELTVVENNGTGRMSHPVRGPFVIESTVVREVA